MTPVSLVHAASKKTDIYQYSSSFNQVDGTVKGYQQIKRTCELFHTHLHIMTISWDYRKLFFACSPETTFSGRNFEPLNKKLLHTWGCFTLLTCSNSSPLNYHWLDQIIDHPFCLVWIHCFQYSAQHHCCHCGPVSSCKIKARLKEEPRCPMSGSGHESRCFLLACA
jgi:hypothetical protein